MTHQHERTARIRGAAMIEMALALPFIVLVIALLLFFGRGIMRVEHAQVMDRYEAWRIAEHAPGAGAYLGSPSHNPLSDPDGQLMNQTFFWKTAQWVRGDASWATVPTQAGDDLQQAGEDLSADTGDLISDALDRFSTDVTASFNTQHPHTFRVYERYEQAIRHHHTRIGNDWKYVNGWRWMLNQNSEGEWVQTDSGSDPWMLDVIRTGLLDDLDNAIDGIGGFNDPDPVLGGANPFADSVRASYDRKPPYRGPTITVPNWQ